MSLILTAQQAQVGGGYSVDSWFEVKLQPMTKLWQGIGGFSEFFLSEEDARQARGAYAGSDPYQVAERLWRMAQVAPNPTHGFRQGLREYVVDLPAKAAMGVCLANPGLGSGGVMQYFIPGWGSYIYATGREFQFSSKGY
jgi:hypothetical protein